MGGPGGSGAGLARLQAAGQVLRERYGPFVAMNQPGAAHPAVGCGYRPGGLQRPCSRLEVCTGRAAAGCPWPGPLNARAPPVLRILVLLGIWLIITATHVSIQSAVQGGANPARRNKPQDARLRVSARARRRFCSCRSLFAYVVGSLNCTTLSWAQVAAARASKMHDIRLSAERC